RHRVNAGVGAVVRGTPSARSPRRQQCGTEDAARARITRRREEPHAHVRPSAPSQTPLFFKGGFGRGGSTPSPTPWIRRHMTTTTPKLLPLGRLIGTPDALAALEAASVHPVTLLRRHATGDW